MGFSTEGQNYRVYYLVNLIVPEEGFVDLYYFETPSNETVIEDILIQRPWLEVYKSNIKLLQFEPLLDK